MSDTPLLGLPYLAAAQAQKHVTHNEALTLLDGLVHLTVASRVVTTPPAVPSDGVRYLLPISPTGAWAGQAGKIAFFMDGGWRFITPREGFSLWVSDEGATLSFNGTSWNASGVPSELQNMSRVGINATADVTNKLTVSSDATLFNHAGAGHQIKLNKNAATDTASFLFQTGFSGRAEIGTTGDDSFHLKVSNDGSSFTEAFVVDGASGRVDVHKTLRLMPQAGDPSGPANGQLWYDSSANSLRARVNGETQSLAIASVTIPTDFGLLAARHLILN
jgi:Protein of unknown function (DUF2793)